MSGKCVPFLPRGDPEKSPLCPRVPATTTQWSRNYLYKPGSAPPAPDPAWGGVCPGSTGLLRSGALGDEAAGRGSCERLQGWADGAAGHQLHPVLLCHAGPRAWDGGWGSPNGGQSSPGQPRSGRGYTHVPALGPRGNCPREDGGLGLALCPRLIGMWFLLSCPPHATQGSTGRVKPATGP